MGQINEHIAEADDALMEKFFADEPFTKEEVTTGVKKAIRERKLFPMLCGESLTGAGMEDVLTNLASYAPNPLEGKAMKKADGGEFQRDENGTPALFVFKTMSDQFGKNSFFQVVSGKATPDLTLTDLRTGNAEKLGHLYAPKGKKNTEVKEICCGDIGVLTKMDKVKTNDTLGKIDAIAPTEYPAPCYSMAVYAKTRGTEDKIATGINKINEDDSPLPSATTRKPRRWFSPAWVTFTWTSLFPSSRASIMLKSSFAPPGSRIVRPFARRSRSMGGTRSRPAVMGSSVTSGLSLSRRMRARK